MVLFLGIELLEAESQELFNILNKSPNQHRYFKIIYSL